jgi:hypothetical protein
MSVTRIASLFLAAAAVVTAITVSSMVRRQSSDLEAMCDPEAEASFQQLRREYTTVMESPNVPFDVTSNNYQAHYSSEIDRCLLLVRKTTSIMRASSDTSYLIDANTRRLYALYIDMNGKIESCSLIPSVWKTKTCKNRDEFNAFVALYMGNKRER